MEADIKKQHLRVLGELDEDWRPTKHAGVYNSIDDLERTRLEFVVKYGEEMRLQAERILSGDPNVSKYFKGWLEFDHPIGKGASLMPPHRGIDFTGRSQDATPDRDRVMHSGDIREAFLNFEYNPMERCWEEVQNFPAVKAAYLAATGSGPPIAL